MTGSETSGHPPVRAWVFDVYGTLLDVYSVAARCEQWFPDRGAELARAWRDKQLQYTWLRSLMRRYAPFDQVTVEALAAACGNLGLDARRAGEAGLADAYLALEPHAEVRRVLDRLQGLPRWVLSNGTPGTLAAALGHAGLRERLDGVLSVDPLAVYKPDPRVYDLALQALKLPAAQIGFVSSNAWDVAGAAACGLQTFWVRRAGSGVPEALDDAPAHVLDSLEALPEFSASSRNG